jgi:hypothetical protein
VSTRSAHPSNVKPRFALLILCLLIPTSVRAESPSDDLRAQLTRLEKAVEKIRGIKPLRAVQTAFVSDRQFDAAYDRLLHRELPASDIQTRQREFALLGLLSKSEDLRRILFQKMSPQVGAFYDEYRKTLDVRNHSDFLLGLRRDLVAREYVHALQDQHFNLQKLSPDESRLRYRSSDASAAHQALVAGDAINTEDLFIFRTYSRAELQAFAKLQTQTSKTPTLPKAFERELDFQYTTGLNFTRQLYYPNGMGAVDAAYGRLPSSTYEIMHPQAYASHWRPASIVLHGVQGFSDWKLADDDVLGALGYDLVLWQYLGKKTATQVVDAYRGDRYILLQIGGHDAMLFRSVWTGGKAADNARRALIDALRARFHTVQITVGAGTTVVERDGAAFFSRAGRNLTMTLAPTAGLAQQLGIAPTT